MHKNQVELTRVAIIPVSMHCQNFTVTVLTQNTLLLYSVVQTSVLVAVKLLGRWELEGLYRVAQKYVTPFILSPQLFNSQFM